MLSNFLPKLTYPIFLVVSAVVFFLSIRQVALIITMRTVPVHYEACQKVINDCAAISATAELLLQKGRKVRNFASI